MDNFLTGLIKFLFKFILLIALLYWGFVVVSLIWKDLNNRFLSDDDGGSEQTELVTEKDVDEMENVEPKSEPKHEVKQSSTKKEKKGPVTIFDEPRDCVTSKSLKVVNILESRYVVAKELRDGLEEYGFTSDLAVVFIDDNNEYYTDQVIKIPRGKCARQIGIYKSTNFMYADKTLPVVKIMNK